MTNVNAVDKPKYLRKLLGCIILPICLVTMTYALEIDFPEPCSDLYSLNKFVFRNKFKTIVLTINNEDNNTKYIAEDEYLKSCFIRNSEPQSYLIIDNINFNIAIWRRLRKIKLSEPNVAIFTTFPTINILEEPLLQIMLRSKWSLIVIIGTTRSDQYVCNNSQINEPMMNNLIDFTDELWHSYQIVNIVIFFPFICPEFYITYGDKKFPENYTIYDRSLTITSTNEQQLHFIYKGRSRKLTQDYALSASIYSRFPTSITECNKINNYLNFKNSSSDGYCGLDGLIMGDIVEYFGFDINKRRYNSSRTYGYVDRDGHITGTLGNVVRGETDISFNSRFLVMYGVTGYSFLYYISSDSLCAIVKRSDEIPLWFFPYDVYSSVMWSLLLITLAILGIFLWLSAKCSSAIMKIKLQRFIIDSMTTGLFGFSSMKSKFLVLKGMCFFSSVIFTSIFQGHVNYAYTTLVRYKQIDNLHNMYETGSSIYTSSGIVNLVDPPYNQLQANLLTRIVLDNNSTYTYNEILINRESASLGRRSDMILETLKYYTDKNGQPLFHVVGECLRDFFLSFIANKEFLFIDDVIILVEKLNEAGLPEQYYRWTQWSLGLFDTSGSLKNSIPRPTSPIVLQDLRIAFSFLLLGYILSTVIFVFEKYVM